jgi:hypothetical protein
MNAMYLVGCLLFIVLFLMIHSITRKKERKSKLSCITKKICRIIIITKDEISVMQRFLGIQIITHNE